MSIGADLTQRDQLLISVTVLTFGLAGAYGYFIYLPTGAQLTVIEEHVTVLHGKNEQAKTDLASGSAARLVQQLAEYQTRLKVLQQLVPTTNEVPALLENVSTAARRVGLDLASVEPMPVLIGEQFDTYRYKVSVKGGYHALAGFLTNVGSLNRIIAPVALDVKQQTAVEKEKAGLKDGVSTLDTDFQIQTYVAHAARAQTPATQRVVQVASPKAVAPEMLVNRETYANPGMGRRDPFVSLMNTEELRPLLADLKLVAIAFDATGRNSVAVLRDRSTNEQYRVKVGQELGRMRVAAIHQKNVVFGIEEFGYSRQESLAMTDSTKVRTQ